ncbi:hypothetical protein [Streptosporangium sp. NPDC049644]|uniref:hypothetical protein n=1 Tax=Streptosporangium sp. NPDC049644 TaxID=3155507 RepID=UPI003426461F
MVSLVALVMVILLACGMPEAERFALSVESMEQVARTAGPGREADDKPRKVGLLEVAEIYRDGDLVYFKLGDFSGVDPYGYVWSPEGEPLDSPDDSATASFEHVQGFWYRWSESW